MVTVHDAVRAMTIASDTPTAVLMQDTLNAARVDQTLASLGIDRYREREPRTADDRTGHGPPSDRDRGR